MRVALSASTAALLAATTACAASSASAAAPHLQASGAVVHGSHFVPREVVRLTWVVSGERSARTVRASAAGAFGLAIPHAKCIGTIVVVARGASGDTARLRLPQVTCGPALGSSP
jgi:hypothetical protein